jgi:hypothetical protein
MQSLRFLKQKNWETYIENKGNLWQNWNKHTFFERAAGMKSNNSSILCENDQIVNDPKEVTEIFNNFFCECSQRYRR